MRQILWEPERGLREVMERKAGAGDRVLLVCGSTARLYCPESPVDTAIVAILDQMEVDHVST